jgi:XTP/dITP diphosphohydrolase
VVSKSGVKLLIATTNAGKLREFERMLAGLGIELVSLRDCPEAPAIEEDADTYAGNARKKALTLARWSGLPALADDSGLEVDALNGQPGVRSARYAGPERGDAANRAKLLQALAGVPESRRGARFRAVIVVAEPSGAMLEASGVCEGRIAGEERGAGGFGYDPVFVVDAEGRTMAELEDSRKDELSHRGRAIASLRPRLLPFLAAR